MTNPFAAGWDFPTSNGGNGTSAPSVAAAPPAPVGASAQMAEAGRDVQPQQQPAQSSPDAAAQVPPDLDALAQQVYTILKRRISAESRRFR